MARIIAIDWDHREVRCVVASSVGVRRRVVSARAVPLEEWTEQGRAETDLAEAIRAVLEQSGDGRGTVLVGVDRSNVELIHMTLPPAKASELPELVAMQASSQSQTAEEDAIIDFVLLGSPAADGPNRAPAEPAQVLAAVFSKQQMAAVHARCAAAGIKPSRVLLRPLAAASLLARRVAPAQGPCLLISPLGSEADLVILADGRPVFQRTVRLPEEAGEDTIAQRLAAEIHRTLLVAQQGPLGGNTIDQAFIFGAADEHSLLVETLGGELNLPARVVDPFEISNLSDGQSPERPARFAALLGMILDEWDGSHAVDFQNPKRPPPRPDRRRIAAVLVAAVLLAIAGIGYYAWSDIAAADEEIARLSGEIKDLDKLLASTADARAIVQAVRQWESGSVVWLDELRDLSLRLPPGKDLVLQRMTMAIDRSGGGGIEVTGAARDPQVVVRMEQTVRDAHHDVRSKRVQEREGKGYTWTFETSISVYGRDKESYLEQQAAAR